MIPLVPVVRRSKTYFAVATDQLYGTESNAKYHFFDSGALDLLRPAVPYFLLLVLLQVGATYAISSLLSASAVLKSRSVLLRLCLSAAITVAVTAALWVHIFA